MITSNVFSPTPTDLVHVGKLIKKIGKRGELLASFSVSFKSFPPAFLVFIKNECIPIINETVLRRDEEYLIKFEDFDYEKATILSNCDVYILPDTYKKSAKIKKEESIVGYVVINELNEVLGNVLEVIAYPHQFLISFDFNGQEVIFPWVESIVLDINHKKKEIHVDLPDGLLQLNFKN